MNIRENDIRDIKGPLYFTSKAAPFFITGFFILLAVFLAVLAGIFIRKRRLGKKPSLLPHEAALIKLKELKEKNLIREGRIKEFYTEMSLIVRHYLEERFSLRAPEMTTEEFLTRLKETDVLNAEQKKKLSEFLSHCDMVKFAKYAPGEEEIDSSFGSAENLIEQTKPEEPKKPEKADKA